MNREDVLSSVQEVFRKIFDKPEMIVTDSMSPKDIKKWDSLNHVILISEIEKAFTIRFDLQDMLESRNVGTICDTILRLKNIE
jgi:acyl carrier protein